MYFNLGSTDVKRIFMYIRFGNFLPEAKKAWKIKSGNVEQGYVMHSKF